MIRIATRQSLLALWQAEHVAALLESHGHATRIVGMTTKGDQILDRTLARVGGKGLFIKELEQAMLDGEADIAVHSMKDVPAHMPEGFELTAVLEGASPLDAFVSNNHATLAELPEGAVLGTASVRRAAQVRHHRPDLRIATLRGNVQTRLAKLDAGEFDAIILAEAGLRRLELDARITDTLDPAVCLPAIGQGVVGIECRRGDDAVIAAIRALEHGLTAVRMRAERAMLAALEGDCSSPIAAHAEITADGLHLTGRVIGLDGQRLIETRQRGTRDDDAAIGLAAARELLAQGAGELLAQDPAGEH